MREKKKRKILVTGATGYIGSFLVKELIKNKEEVTCLVRKTSDKKAIDELKEIGATIVIGDICVRNSLDKAVRGNDIVIHCAAVHDADYKNLKETNVDGTRNILEACMDNNVKRFIYMSSATVFGNIKNGTEKSGCHPGSDYSKTKYMGEKVVEEYMKKGVVATILRPPMVYGFHPRTSILKWARYIKKGYFLIFGKGNNNIEIVYIDDLIRAVLLVLNKKISEGKTYIITNPTTTMNEFTSIIAAELGVKKPKHIPIWLAHSLAFCITLLSKCIGIKSPLTKTNIRNMTRDRCLSFKKAKGELGYLPKISKEKGIKIIISKGKAKGYF